MFPSDDRNVLKLDYGDDQSYNSVHILKKLNGVLKLDKFYSI